MVNKSLYYIVNMKDRWKTSTSSCINVHSNDVCPPSTSQNASKIRIRYSQLLKTVVGVYQTSSVLNISQCKSDRHRVYSRLKHRFIKKFTICILIWSFIKNDKESCSFIIIYLIVINKKQGAKKYFMIKKNVNDVQLNKLCFHFGIRFKMAHFFSYSRVTCTSFAYLNISKVSKNKQPTRPNIIYSNKSSSVYLMNVCSNRKSLYLLKLWW